MHNGTGRDNGIRYKQAMTQVELIDQVSGQF